MDEKKVIEVTIPAPPRYCYEVLHRVHYEMPRNKQVPAATLCKIVGDMPYGLSRYLAFEDAYRRAIYDDISNPSGGQEAIDDAERISVKLGKGFIEMHDKMMFALDGMQSAITAMAAATTEKEMTKAVATFNEVAEVMKINT